jgi:hypothetical protein
MLASVVRGLMAAEPIGRGRRSARRGASALRTVKEGERGKIGPAWVGGMPGVWAGPILTADPMKFEPAIAGETRCQKASSAER